MIVYMGVSGAGKTTQCTLLAKQLGYVHLIMSDMIRAHATPEQQTKMSKGELLDDADAIAIVDAGLRAQSNPKAIILDGFPRTVRQARWLLEQANNGRDSISAVINLILPTAKVLERLTRRSRADDTPTVIAARIGWYEANTAPAVAYFKEQGLPVYDIDGNGSPESVLEATVKALQLSAVRP